MQERRQDTYSLLNPVPYPASHYGEKLHLDQNEKLVTYGVTHVIAVTRRVLWDHQCCTAADRKASAAGTIRSTIPRQELKNCFVLELLSLTHIYNY